MRRVVLWSFWIVPLVALWVFVDREAQTARVTPYGLEFLNISEQVVVFAMLLPLLILAPILATPRWMTGTLCLLATMASGWALNQHVYQIAYNRTPACWGIHSVDWGSGAGCPPGMRADFTLEQIREYDRKRR